MSLRVTFSDSRAQLCLSEDLKIKVYKMSLLFLLIAQKTRTPPKTKGASPPANHCIHLPAYTAWFSESMNPSVLALPCVTSRLCVRTFELTLIKLLRGNLGYLSANLLMCIADSFSPVQAKAQFKLGFRASPAISKRQEKK